MTTKTSVDFANLLETTKIPQSGGTLVRIKPDSLEKGETFNFDEHEHLIEGACCMGLITLEVQKTATVNWESILVFENESSPLGIEDCVVTDLTRKVYNINHEGRINYEFVDDVRQFILDKEWSTPYNLIHSGLNLDALNDTHELSFVQIAELVRTFPNAWFKS